MVVVWWCPLSFPRTPPLRSWCVGQSQGSGGRLHKGRGRDRGIYMYKYLKIIYTDAHTHRTTTPPTPAKTKKIKLPLFSRRNETGGQEAMLPCVQHHSSVRRAKLRHLRPHHTQPTSCVSSWPRPHETSCADKSWKNAHPLAGHGSPVPCALASSKREHPTAATATLPGRSCPTPPSAHSHETGTSPLDPPRCDPAAVAQAHPAVTCLDQAQHS